MAHVEAYFPTEPSAHLETNSSTISPTVDRAELNALGSSNRPTITEAIEAAV